MTTLLEKGDPEKAAREVLDACADCDVCRFLMDTSCHFFPELYRLYDREMEDRKPITSDELRGNRKSALPTWTCSN